MEKIRPVKYLQTDARWKNVDYSAKGESTTIGKEGCGPTSAAMLLATFVDKNVTPVTTCNWAKSKGYKALGQGTYYSYFAPQFAQYGIECYQLNYQNLYKSNTSYAKEVHRKALEAIKQGYYVICCMGPGNWTTSGHFIVWYDYNENGTVYINDPYSTKQQQEKSSIWKLQNEVKYYFVVKIDGFKREEEKEEEEEEMEQRFKTVDEVPSYGKELVNELIKEKSIADENNIDLTKDMIRTMVIMERHFEKKQEQG